MAFGDLITNGTGSLTGASIGASNAIPINGGTGVTVVLGDLVVAVLAEQTSLTASGTTDNLGNTYTASNSGTLTGAAISGRMYYSTVDKPGTLTTVTMTATSSAHDFSCVAAVYRGLFATSVLDTNIANATTDITSVFTCPATGTRNQASDLIIGWAAANNNGADTSSGNYTVAVDAPRLNAHACIAHRVVTTTADDSPTIASGTNPANQVLGTTSFRQAVLPPIGGWFSQQNPEKFLKPFPPIHQQFTVLEPKEQPILGGLASTEYDQTITKLFLMQGNFYAPQPITALVVASIYSPFTQSDPLFSKPFPVAKQLFETTSLQTIENFTKGWWGQSPDRFWKPYPVIGQQFGSAQPTKYVNYTTGWWGQPPDLFTKSFPVVNQKFDSFSAQGAVVSYTPQGWMWQSPDIFTKPYKVTGQQFGSAQPQAYSNFTTGWWGQSPDRFLKPYPVVLQKFEAFDNKYTPNVVVQYFAWPQNDAIYRKSYSVTLQQFQGGAVPNQQPSFFAGTGFRSDVLVNSYVVIQNEFYLPQTSIAPQGWMGQYPDLFKPYRVLYQRSEATTPQPTAVQYQPWFQSEIRIKPQIVQTFAGFATQTTVAASTPSGFWFGQNFPAFIKPFPVQYQPFGEIPPYPYLQTANQPTVDSSDSMVLVRRRRLVQNAFYFPYPQTSTTPQGWMYQSPVMFIKSYPVAQQRFSDLVLTRNLFVTAPPGWMGQSPALFRKGLNVALPQFAANNGRGNVPTSDFGAGWMYQSPVIFGKSLPASVTLFSEFAPNVYVTVTPAGRRTYSYISSCYIQ